MQYRSIAFVDAMNYGPNCSLDSFGKMWGANVNKGCFPYEMYKSIDEMVDDTEWPPMHKFKTTLCRTTYTATTHQIEQCFRKLNEAIGINKDEFMHRLTGSRQSSDLQNGYIFPVDVVVYCKMWEIFESGKKEGSMTNMMDYLCYYNALDTEVLAEAMTKYMTSFLQTFQINPNEHITLPSIAERVLWNYYDNKRYQPYSFNQDFGDISKLIRSQLAGGLSCVFARHVEIGDGEIKYQHNVHHASNGNRFRHLIAFDVNSKSFE